MAAESRPTHDGWVYVTDAEAHAVLSACRVLVAVSARSIAAAGEKIDPVQFRALTVLAGREELSLGELADAAGLSLSTASNVCERMAATGRIDRAGDQSDRRQMMLTLTDDGRRLAAQVAARRREAVELILARIPPPRRAQFTALLREFAAAVGLTDDGDRVTPRIPAG